jgi:hypothetical protein
LGRGGFSAIASSLSVAERQTEVFEMVFVQLVDEIRVDQVVKKSGLVPFKIQGLEPNGDVHDVLGNLRSKSRVTWRSAKEQICSPQSTKNVRLVCPASQPSGSIRPIRQAAK